jgi:hypothetical protein
LLTISGTGIGAGLFGTPSIITITDAAWLPARALEKSAGQIASVMAEY